VVVRALLASLLLPAAAFADPPVRDDHPVEVAGITDAVQLATSEAAVRTCARLATGHVTCWGGQLTGKTEVNDPRPVEVPGLTDAVDIAVSVHNACARRKSGEVVCWGAPDVHERVLWKRPTPVPALAKTTVLWGDVYVCGAGAGVLVCTDGKKDGRFHAPEGAPTRAWHGMNGRPSWRCFEVAGRIECEQAFVERRGEGTTVTPEGAFGDLDGARDIQLPSNTIDTTCVVRPNGEVGCRDYSDQPNAYETVPALGDVTALALGCALRRDGTVACWNDSLRRRDAVTAVPGIADAVELVGSSVHHCVRRKTGRVVCWGYIGLLGDGRR
jgi:hypothetical protein